MVLRLRILGWEVFAVELERGGTAEEVPEGITSGSSHNFERLPEEPYYEEHAFGFRVTTAPR